MTLSKAEEVAGKAKADAEAVRLAGGGCASGWVAGWGGLVLHSCTRTHRPTLQSDRPPLAARADIGPTSSVKH